jgi:hypothetical protein
MYTVYAITFYLCISSNEIKLDLSIDLRRVDRGEVVGVAAEIDPPHGAGHPTVPPYGHPCLVSLS